jgi:hypothetical protein
VEEKRAGILYNDTVDQDVAQLGSVGQNFTGSNPVIPTYSSPLGSNEGSIEMDSNWIYIFSFYETIYIQCIGGTKIILFLYFTVVSTVIRKRS